MNYREAVEFLLALPDLERKSSGPGARSMSLAAMKSLLDRLEHPELGRKTVHITGSKGKGSVAAFLASILSRSASTSLYTSPHLHSFRERICLDLCPVSEEDFSRAVSLIRGAVLAEHASGSGPVSTFGAMTALFFYLSRLHHMHWQVVEVGMGGLHDATNVFSAKELVVISAISLEHTRVLGKTRLEIAENKAGIIRPGSTVVLAPQADMAVTELVRRRALEQGADFVSVDESYEIIAESFDRQTQSFTLAGESGRRRFNLRMLGRHQLANAATALAAVDALSRQSLLGLSYDEICEALLNVQVPGRLELINESPLVVADGAHNGESSAALVAALKRHFGVEAIVFVLGVNSDKNVRDIVDSLSPICSCLVATRSRSEKAMEPEAIVEAAGLQGLSCRQADSLEKALVIATDLVGRDGLVCVTGSLYLVAEAREYYLGSDPSWQMRYPGQAEKEQFLFKAPKELEKLEKKQK